MEETDKSMKDMAQSAVDQQQRDSIIDERIRMEQSKQMRQTENSLDPLGVVLRVHVCLCLRIRKPAPLFGGSRFWDFSMQNCFINSLFRSIKKQKRNQKELLPNNEIERQNMIRRTISLKHETSSPMQQTFQEHLSFLRTDAWVLRNISSRIAPGYAVVQSTPTVYSPTRMCRIHTH